MTTLAVDLKRFSAAADTSPMSSSPAIAAPDHLSAVHIPSARTEVPAAPPLADTIASEPNRRAEEIPDPKAVLPFLLIMTGVGIYFIAIAAFASFVGVGAGVAVIVLGGTVYTCRGLGRHIRTYPPASIDQAYYSRVPHAACPDASENPESKEEARLEVQGEICVRTTEEAVPV